MAARFCLLCVKDANAIGDFRVSAQHLILCKSLIQNDEEKRKLEVLLETTAQAIETHIQADKLQSGRRYFLLKCRDDCF